MKKILVAVMILAIAVFAFAACNNTDAGNHGDDSAFDTSKNIAVVAREDGSGTKAAFMELIDLKDMPDPAHVIIQTSTAAVLAEVKNNPAAIAYDSLGYVTDEVKKLKVDGVECTVENIKNDTYRVMRPLSVVYQDASLSELNAAFLAFLQSADAQQIIAAGGYVSLLDNAAAYTSEGALSGVIDISGSTSLQPLMILLAAEFENLQPNVSVTVSGGGSGTGYQNAENGTSAFGMISAEFDQEKAPSCKGYTVAKDGIAVIVNPDNPLDTISMEQLKSIYDAEAGGDALIVWNQLIGD